VVLGISILGVSLELNVIIQKNRITYGIHELTMSDLSDFGTIATIVAGFATAGGLIFVGYQTRMLRNERSLTLRAWIGIGEPEWENVGYHDDNGTFISKKEFDKLSVEEQNKLSLINNVEIKNYGQLPAEKLASRMKIVAGYNQQEKTWQIQVL
jgi:hypothetical protein